MLNSASTRLIAPSIHSSAQTFPSMMLEPSSTMPMSDRGRASDAGVPALGAADVKFFE